MTRSRRGKKRSSKVGAAPRAAKPGSRLSTAASATAHLPPESENRPVPVVAVGASAGGLEAFSQVLEALGAEPSVALVFVQHLAPQHESALPTLLSGRTKLPVIQVTEGIRIEKNTVYVIPPNAQMEIRDGELHLNPRPDDRSQYTPIDFFFRSLAETAGSGAIGVILSGSSSDGSAGLREIKAVGGITIVQDPRTARYDGMPRAAIATEAVDLVLSPADIAKEILRIGRHPYVKLARPRHAGDDLTIEEDQLQRLIKVLRNASGIDFTYYKSPTIKRRLQRRMVLQKISDVGQYLRFLQTTPDEARKLTQDILINVTRFFREPQAFTALADDVFPDLVAHQTGETPIRVWVPGCSTGEEAYSVAIALLEHLGEQSPGTPIQIFGTDVSEAAIEHARNGVYSPTIAGDVSAERLRRFFTKIDGSFRITKPVRDICVFARQDLTRDPPFSRLDLIVCRNVLIYLGPPLQKKVLNVFHYALKPTGFLMLGHAETAGQQAELFAITSKKNRIYRKKAGAYPGAMSFSTDFTSGRKATAADRRASEHGTGPLQNEAQRFLLDNFAPPGVIVDGDLRILQFLGHTGRFLEPAPGDANLTLAKMIRDGLLHGLHTALHQARREGRRARRGGLHVRVNGHDLEVALEVVPLGDDTAKERHFLVLFEEQRETEVAESRPRRGQESRPERRARDRSVHKLQQELAATREYLQSIIQDVEAANEELQSANEEILSSNEELQSTNEELDTAREELQSTNEELNTVNEELHGRNEELSRVNSDLLNLLGSVNVALVIVENDLRIRRFTPMAERVLNLIPGDVGRPIGHIKPNIECPDLEDLIQEVINSVTPREREVRDQEGRWFSLQVRPYKNIDNRIDGAVLSLVDIDTGKRAELENRSGRDYADTLIEAIGDPLLVLDRELRVRKANAAFHTAFQISAAHALGEPFAELGDGRWRDGELQHFLDDIANGDATTDGFEFEYEFAGVGPRTVRLRARRVDGLGDSPPLIVLGFQGVPSMAATGP